MEIKEVHESSENEVEEINEVETLETNEINESSKDNNPWRGWGIFFSIFAIIPLFLGFYKMFAYDSVEYTWKKAVNSYVGGDAYNYIINANYATGYFVLAGILFVLSIGCGIMWNFYEIRKNISNQNKGKNEEL